MLWWHLFFYSRSMQGPGHFKGAIFEGTVGSKFFLGGPFEHLKTRDPRLRLGKDVRHLRYLHQAHLQQELEKLHRRYPPKWPTWPFNSIWYWSVKAPFLFWQSICQKGQWLCAPEPGPLPHSEWTQDRKQRPVCCFKMAALKEQKKIGGASFNGFLSSAGWIVPFGTGTPQ